MFNNKCFTSLRDDSINNKSLLKKEYFRTKKENNTDINIIINNKKWTQKIQCSNTLRRFEKDTALKKHFQAFFMNRANMLELRIHNLATQTCKIFESDNYASNSSVSEQTSENDTEVVTPPPSDDLEVISPPENNIEEINENSSTPLIIIESQNHQKILDQEAGENPIYK